MSHVILASSPLRKNPSVSCVGWRAEGARSPNQATAESILTSQITLPVETAADIRLSAIRKQSFNKTIARRIDHSRRLLKCLRSTLPVNLPNRAKQVAADVAPRIWPPEKEQYDKENVNRRVTARRDPCRRHAKQSHRRFRL